MVHIISSGLDEHGHPEIIGDEIVLTDAEMADLYQVRAPSQVNFSPHLWYAVYISPLIAAYGQIAATFDRMAGSRARELAEAYRNLVRGLTQGDRACQTSSKLNTGQTPLGSARQTTTSQTISSTKSPVSRPSKECSETPTSPTQTGL